VKLETDLLIGPAKNCHTFSPVRFLIPKLFWDSGEGLKIASCVASQTHNISISFKFGELLSGIVLFQAFLDSFHEGIV